MPELYPGAKWRPSTIPHPMRPATLGITMHWTVGREAGDITVLDGPNVDCQFYVAKDGDVYQFLDMGSTGWHAKTTANTYTIGIEHESFGEPYTDPQLKASAKLVAFLCEKYRIPIRHVDPSGSDLDTFRGIFGHRDLSLGGERVDGNDHTDTVPTPPGWDKYLAEVNFYAKGIEPPPPLENSGSLRLIVAGRMFAGWENAAGPIAWIARNGLKDKDAVIAWKGGLWRGAKDVENVAKNLYRRYLEPRGL
jgi:hypothetical protein